MQKITLNIITVPEIKRVRLDLNKISVFVHCGLLVRFTSYKAAKAFEKRCQAWINEIFSQLIDEYIVCHSQFWRLWLYYDVDRQDLFEAEKLLNLINKSIGGAYMIHNNPGTGAQPYFNRITIILKSLITIYDLFEYKQKKRNNWESLRFIRMKKDYLHYLLKQVESWPN